MIYHLTSHMDNSLNRSPFQPSQDCNRNINVDSPGNNKDMNSNILSKQGSKQSQNRQVMQLGKPKRQQGQQGVPQGQQMPQGHQGSQGKQGQKGPQGPVGRRKMLKDKSFDFSTSSGKNEKNFLGVFLSPTYSLTPHLRVFLTF